MRRYDMRSSLLVLGLASCGGSAAPPSTAPSTSEPEPAATPATITPASAADAPEISRSVGVAGGVVILWPRVPKSSNDALGREIAGKVQDRLRALVAKARPGEAIDVRPEPERVCPRSGCTAIAVGAALMRHDQGCAVAVTISASGQSPATIVPWVGEVKLRAATVPFREPPEGAIEVLDYQRCDAVATSLGAREAEIESAIRAGR
jgi:hypothetical protein